MSLSRGRGKARASLDLVDAAASILQAIQPASVRAVCYQLFTRGVIPSMEKAHTNRVSRLLTWAREQGVIPWAWIVDETRVAERVNAFTDPEEYVEVVKRSYRRDRWSDQPRWVEVWSEKGTIRGTLWPILRHYGVTFRVMHGYASTTTAHDTAEESRASDKPVTVLYLGDWDPSGLHMSDVDIPTRLRRYGAWFRFQRLALLAGDLADLPGFSAHDKVKDRRYRWFVDRYGTRCWELDAMSPVLLRQRVGQCLDGLVDHEAWDRHGAAERAEIDSLTSILSTWPTISRQAPKCDGDEA